MADPASGNAEGVGAVPPAAPAQAPAGAPPAQESLLQILLALWHDLPGLLSDRVELLSLEIHRAGIALAQIVALVVATAILGVTAWLVLWAGVVMGLVAMGLHMFWALLLALVLNLVVAAWAVARARGLLKLLRLPATRRHLTMSPPSEPPAAAADASTSHGRPLHTAPREQPAT